MTDRGGSGAFTVRGMRNGSLVHVTWVDGAISGDPPTVDLVEVACDILRESADDPLVRRMEDRRVERGADPLSDAGSALAVIASVFDRVQQVVRTDDDQEEPARAEP